jgi:hypothetical protein
MTRQGIRPIPNFQTVGKPRLAFIQDERLNHADMFHLPDGLAQQARHDMFR